MVKRFLFQHRDGQTPLHPDLRATLLPQHIQNNSELDEYEEQNIALGISWLESQEQDGLDHLFWRKLHKKLFEEVWAWAGKTRAHELQNEEFLPVHQIQNAVAELQATTQFWIENNTFPPKEIAARFHERLLTIHPFPNGNGRFSRILVSYICRKQKWPEPLWSAAITDHKLRRDSYITAVKEARHDENFEPLIAFMFS